MRRALKDKLTGILDEPRRSSATPPLERHHDQRPVTDRMVNFVREKSGTLVSTVQEHVSSVTDTTGTLAKQKLLQTLVSSGVVRSEQIRHALQIGIGYFLDQLPQSLSQPSPYIERQKFPGAGGATPAHSLPDFDIEAYGMGIFQALMQIYGVQSDTLREQICHGELKEIVNPSSSGSLLYLTSNSTYLIKTIRDYDAKFIQQKFLHEYLQHLQRQPNTFLAKLFGVYGYIPYLSQHRAITVDSFTLRFVILSNFIPRNVDIHEKYDLKGSSYRRDADIKERLKSSATFKDNDFRDLHPRGFTLRRDVYDQLRAILTEDVDFLEKLNIMDYSLLLTVHNIDNPVAVKRPGSLEALMGTIQDRMLTGMTEQQVETQRRHHHHHPRATETTRMTASTDAIYEEISTYDPRQIAASRGISAMNEKGERVLLFIGLIDILQTFDICKVMQRQYQTVENRDVVAERSIVETDFYARRFKEFLFARVFHPANESADHRPSVPQHNTSDDYYLYPSLTSF